MYVKFFRVHKILRKKFLWDLQSFHFMFKMIFSKILNLRSRLIGVPKVPVRVFDELKNEIQDSKMRFCFYFNKADEIQIIDYYFHV